MKLIAGHKLFRYAGKSSVVFFGRIDFAFCPVDFLDITPVFNQGLIIIRVILLLKRRKLVKPLYQQAFSFQIGKSERTDNRINAFFPGPALYRFKQRIRDFLIVDRVKPGKANPLFSVFSVCRFLKDSGNAADDTAVPVRVVIDCFAGVIVDIILAENLLFISVKRGNEAGIAALQIKRKI